MKNLIAKARENMLRTVVIVKGIAYLPAMA